MEVFLLIVINVIFPVFILIGIGAFFHRKYIFDLNTLSKITTYLLIPAVCFVNIYSSELGGKTMLMTFGFLILQSACLMIFSSVVAKVIKLDMRMSSSFKNSIVLNNAGNFGLPVSQLVFSHNPLGASIQVMVLLFQNFLSYTYGLMNSVSANRNGTTTMLKELLKNPIIYSCILGLLLNMMTIQIPSLIWNPIENISNAFIAVALITLGAQSAFLNLTRITLSIILSLVGRLLVSPIIAFIFILIFGLEGVIAQALLIASSFPTSRNSALFALEFDNYPDYAAQIVLLSTLFSSVTVTVVVYLSKVLF